MFTTFEPCLYHSTSIKARLQCVSTMVCLSETGYSYMVIADCTGNKTILFYHNESRLEYSKLQKLDHNEVCIELWECPYEVQINESLLL